MVVVYGAMVDIEITKPMANLERGQINPRFQMFRDSWNNIDMLVQGATLELLGATRERDLSSGLKLYGNSWDEQEAAEDDTDQKGPVFPRGFQDMQQQQSSSINYDPVSE